MRFPRLSIASIGLVVAVFALDFAVVRNALLDNRPVSWRAFAVWLLPAFDALLIGLYWVRRRDRRTPGAVGFLAAGAVATGLVVASCALAPEPVLDLLRAVLQPIATPVLNGVTRLVGNAAIQSGGALQWSLMITFEILIPAAFLCLPPLLVALAGRALARRAWRGPTSSPTPPLPARS
jgi:hypothetical protein